jgi:SAM-dependent methyltransferase
MNYNERYQQVVRDSAFIQWRKRGAFYKANNILSVCEDIPVKSVIEVGCGTGAIVAELIERKFGRAYFGTDLSAAALQVAKQCLGREFRGGFVADAAHLPLERKAFSVAILSHVLEHLDNPLQAVQEAGRVAEFVVVEVPTEEVFTNWIRRRFLGRQYSSIKEAGHVQFWSPRSFLRFLHENCRLEVLAVRRTPISKEEDFYGKKGIRRLKPTVKHVVQAILPSFLLGRIFTTHTTALCRPTIPSTELTANAVVSTGTLQFPAAKRAHP